MKIRLAAMAAGLIEPGDALVNVPCDLGGQRSDRATVIGTVLSVRDHGGARSWLIRNDAGSMVEHPVQDPVGEYVLTYIHVPSPSK